MSKGFDFGQERIKLARGKQLSFTQEDLKISGHAIEVRVYAEDPKNNFLPDIGNLKTYRLPEGPGIRVDNGFEEGMDIPIYYDPMISKLVTYGHDREEARARMLRAIDDYEITGVQTTLGFCKFALEHDAFINGKFDTHFVKLYFKPELLDANQDHDELAAILAAYKFDNDKSSGQQKQDNSRSTSLWKQNRT